ncbi:Rhomboid protease GluP [Gimesia panareensis]|uniref:Rhomboid protease GluP n=1 Tax=Gimesia panareensis TaxID=2527978 RepID=A0A517Q987_9PLAN|nr:rhomboid family intramembrane serine protease [Gimesia panareensis]QDT28165.1 Rhomboid protease GluP [Gimesia panareensis]
MLHSLKRFCSRYPVTALFLAVAVGLFLAVQAYRISHRTSGQNGFDDALWKLGAVQPLVFVHDHPLIEEKDYPTGGPFDLWAGEWWRILVSGFHHGDILHLVMNCVAIAFLGHLIEPVMRRWVYVLFLILATFISLLPEYYWEHYPVGLSGAAFAMFGMLILLRQTNEHIAEVFTEREIHWGLGWLFLCFVLTYLGIMNIANAAHVAGFLYGLLAGVVLINQSRFASLLRYAFVVSHLLLIPATWLICHPYWNGKYYWYLARHSDDLDQRIAYLKKGVELSPGEPKIGAELALSLYRTEKVPFDSWETILQSLKRNRSYEKGVDLARLIWKQFDSDEQKAKALKKMSEIFGSESEAWSDRLQLAQTEMVQTDAPPSGVSDGPTGDLLFLNRSNSQKKSLKPRDLTAPPVDPGSPQSAVEGVTL